MSFLSFLKPKDTTIRLAFGNGQLSPKALSLANDEANIRRADFGFPDKAAFNPNFFSKHLTESGALEAKTLEKANERVMKHQFDAERKEAIIAAAETFYKKGHRLLFSRTDDWDIGLGLTESAPVRGRTVAELAESIERQFKKQLCSEFDPNVIAFRERKGTPDHRMGALLMPFYGERTKMSKDGPEHTTTVFSINYFGKNPEGKALISVGGGLGGANHKYAEHYIGKEISHESLSEAMCKQMHWPDCSGGAGNYNLGVPSDLYASLLLRLNAIRRDIDSKINSLIGLTGQRYLEIVSNGADDFNWMVVQSAPIEIVNAEKPDYEKKSILMSTEHVIGTNIVKADKIRFKKQGFHPSNEDWEYNKYNRNYLLVVEIPTAGGFRNEWQLQHISNAAAILLVVGGVRQTFFSHLGGYYRELGIPVLAGNIAFNQFRKLAGDNGEHKFVVHVDEFAPEGFVAVEN